MHTSHPHTARLDHILRGWVVLWLLALPLFHIHPETDPHHGEAGHVHAVAVHTVFSGDLEGEFGEHTEAASVRHHAYHKGSEPLANTLWLRPDSPKPTGQAPR